MTDAAEHRRAWGENIRTARETHAMTLTEVATECGVAYQSVQDWENGRSTPGPVNQARLCALFGLPRDELFPLDTSTIGDTSCAAHSAPRSS